MVSYLKSINGEFAPSSAQEILQGNQPFSLFLGGLLHINKLGIGKGLSGILNKLTQNNKNIPTYVAIRSTEPNIGQSAADMYTFENDEIISSEALELFHDIILPTAISNEQQDIRKHLARVNIIGYSYGTSLIQQLETLLFKELDDNQISTPEALKIMGAVGAINIGPVARPLIWSEPQNLAARFNHHSNFSLSGQGLFSQAFFFRRHDKICQDVLQNQLLLGAQKDSPVDIRNNESTAFVLDNTGDAWIRRYGFNKLGLGQDFPFIHYQMDHEGHDLRIYTNTLHTDDSMSIYPSIATSPYIIRCCQTMIAESSAVANGADRQFLEVLNELKSPDITSKLKTELQHLHTHFQDVVSGYNNADLADGVQILRQALKEKQVANAPKSNP